MGGGVYLDVVVCACFFSSFVCHCHREDWTSLVELRLDFQYKTRS
jgi:hypothetical protein